MSFICKSGFTLVISFNLVFSASQRILHKDVKRIYCYKERSSGFYIIYHVWNKSENSYYAYQAILYQPKIC